MKSENSVVDVKLLSPGEKARTIRTIPVQTKRDMVLFQTLAHPRPQACNVFAIKVIVRVIVR